MLPNDFGNLYKSHKSILSFLNGGSKSDCGAIAIYEHSPDVNSYILLFFGSLLGFKWAVLMYTTFLVTMKTLENISLHFFYLESFGFAFSIADLPLNYNSGFRSA